MLGISNPYAAPAFRKRASPSISLLRKTIVMALANPFPVLAGISMEFLFLVPFASFPITQHFCPARVAVACNSNRLERRMLQLMQSHLEWTAF